MSIDDHRMTLQFCAFIQPRSLLRGQNSYGAAGGAQAGWQKNLASYCTDSTTDIFVLAFLDVFFSTGGDPEVNFANADNSCTTFSGTGLLNCPQIGAGL